MSVSDEYLEYVIDQLSFLGEVHYKKMFGWAVENGYRSIRLDVFSLNTRGVEFYESLGVSKAGESIFSRTR